MWYSQSYNPTKVETIVVWASPCSLVTTKGISYDLFSSSYLDISFHWVLVLLRQVIPDRLPHSEISGSKRLLAPHRSLSQPITSFILFSTLGIHSLLIKNLFFSKKNEIYYTTVNYLHQHKTFQNKKTFSQSFA